MSILEKFDKVFGNILPPEAVLEQFYTAIQTAAWSSCVGLSDGRSIVASTSHGEVVGESGTQHAKNEMLLWT